MRRNMAESDRRIEHRCFRIDRRRWDARIGKHDVLAGPDGFEPGGLRGLRDVDHRVGVACNSEVDSKEADFHSGLPEELGCPDQLDATVALDRLKVIPVVRDNGSIPPSHACCDQGIKRLCDDGFRKWSETPSGSGPF
jgi:hypothetical protein